VATYIYTAYIPAAGETDYPQLISDCFTQLGTDITAVSTVADAAGDASKATSPTLDDLMSQDATGNPKASGITPGGSNSVDMVAVGATQTLTNKTITASDNVLDATVEDIAGLTPSANQFVGGNGANLVMRTATQTKTSLAITESDITDLGTLVTMNTNIGTTVQAHDADTAKLDTAQEWTKTQNFSTSLTTSSATLNIDFSSNQVTIVNTLQHPTTIGVTAGSMKRGATYLLAFLCDGTSRDISWSARFIGDTTTYSSSINSWNLYSAVCVVDTSGAEVVLLTHALVDVS
jgi:hypothetical protein